MALVHGRGNSSRHPAKI